VEDLNRSKGFFAKLGYTYTPQFTDDNAACMVISEEIFVMLLRKDFFRNFIKKEIAD
jgi:predicted lactoylglutathione lyase